MSKYPKLVQMLISVLQAEKCKITEGLNRTLTTGESYCITLDTEHAGQGAVTCRIRSTSGRYIISGSRMFCIDNKIDFSDLDINVVDNGDGTVSIYYTVKDSGEYTINIKFGGQPVPGGFYTFTVSAELIHLINLHDLLSLNILAVNKN